MDIDCDWCICGKKTTNGRLYCSEECKLSDCASDSSPNSDYSYLSNSSYASMITVTNCMPNFYNKKLNKNYTTFIKSNNGSNKSLNLGYNLGVVNSKYYSNNCLNHSSPTSQVPLSSKYNQKNMRRISTGGLITSNLMTMNIPAVTTPVNTSGHIIKTSTSVPKTDMDSVMTPPSYLYNRRYSLPFNKGNNQNHLNLPLNTHYNNMNINNNALTPSPIGLLNINNNTQAITSILNNTIYSAITKNNLIKNNDFSNHDNENNLNFYDLNEYYNTNNTNTNTNTNTNNN
eukprot:jgi/Orpsp1_1/1187882/evm.model.d7180000060888.1